MYNEGKKFTLTCSDEGRCVPSYNNLKEIRFMASGSGASAPQTCETLVQGMGAKYTEIGDFQKKNFGQPTTNQKNFNSKVWVSNHEITWVPMFVTAKLCGIVSDDPPDPPICDILQGAGSWQAVQAGLKHKTFGAFGFEAIPTQFGGDGQQGDALQTAYDSNYGMLFTQLGMGHYWSGFGKTNKINECQYANLYTTAIGCNVPQMPSGQEMTCLKFVKTKLRSTPHGAGP